mmetsp:Transcript_29878/g.41338  ORF Transcript_29878/g.41338 Transcript_29878/m.41338 type:complete len:257 (+) Transcript_29878:1472-2242(+)
MAFSSSWCCALNFLSAWPAVSPSNTRKIWGTWLILMGNSCTGNSFSFFKALVISWCTSSQSVVDIALWVHNASTFSVMFSPTNKDKETGSPVADEAKLNVPSGAKPLPTRLTCKSLTSWSLKSGSSCCFSIKSVTAVSGDWPAYTGSCNIWPPSTCTSWNNRGKKSRMVARRNTSTESCCPASGVRPRSVTNCSTFATISSPFLKRNLTCCPSRFRSTSNMLSCTRREISFDKTLLNLSVICLIALSASAPSSNCI